MDNEKDLDLAQEEESEGESFAPVETATRARNRTVMLTPDVTGEVRARIAGDFQQQMQQPFSTPAAEHRTSMPTASSPRPSVGMSGGMAERVGLPGGFHQPSPQPQAAYVTPVAPSPAPARHENSGVIWTKESPLVGFLVSFDENKCGEVFDLRTGRLIVTSEAAATGNFLIIKNESVSPMHAILRVGKGGEIQVLDQLSEHGTKISRFGSSELEELSGEKTTVEHGDIVWFGERKFHVCVIAGATGDEA